MIVKAVKKTPTTSKKTTKSKSVKKEPVKLVVKEPIKVEKEKDLPKLKTEIKEVSKNKNKPERVIKTEVWGGKDLILIKYCLTKYQSDQS